MKHHSKLVSNSGWRVNFDRKPLPINKMNLSWGCSETLINEINKDSENRMLGDKIFGPYHGFGVDVTKKSYFVHDPCHVKLALSSKNHARINMVQPYARNMGYAAEHQARQNANNGRLDGFDHMRKIDIDKGIFEAPILDSDPIKFEKDDLKFIRTIKEKLAQATGIKYDPKSPVINDKALRDALNRVK